MNNKDLKTHVGESSAVHTDPSKKTITLFRVQTNNEQIISKLTSASQFSTTDISENVNPLNNIPENRCIPVEKVSVEETNKDKNSNDKGISENLNSTNLDLISNHLPTKSSHVDQKVYNKRNFKSPSQRKAFISKIVSEFIAILNKEIDTSNTRSEKSLESINKENILMNSEQPEGNENSRKEQVTQTGKELEDFVFKGGAEKLNNDEISEPNNDGNTESKETEQTSKESKLETLEKVIKTEKIQTENTKVIDHFLKQINELIRSGTEKIISKENSTDQLSEETLKGKLIKDTRDSYENEINMKNILGKLAKIKIQETNATLNNTSNFSKLNSLRSLTFKWLVGHLEDLNEKKILEKKNVCPDSEKKKDREPPTENDLKLEKESKEVCKKMEQNGKKSKKKQKKNGLQVFNKSMLKSFYKKTKKNSCFTHARNESLAITPINSKQPNVDSEIKENLEEKKGKATISYLDLSKDIKIIPEAYVKPKKGEQIYNEFVKQINEAEKVQYIGSLEVKSILKSFNQIIKVSEKSKEDFERFEMDVNGKILKMGRCADDNQEYPKNLRDTDPIEFIDCLEAKKMLQKMSTTSRSTVALKTIKLKSGGVPWTKPENDESVKKLLRTTSCIIAPKSRVIKTASESEMKKKEENKEKRDLSIKKNRSKPVKAAIPEGVDNYEVPLKTNKRAERIGSQCRQFFDKNIECLFKSVEDKLKTYKKCVTNFPSYMNVKKIVSASCSLNGIQLFRKQSLLDEAMVKDGNVLRLESGMTTNPYGKNVHLPLTRSSHVKQHKWESDEGEKCLRPSSLGRNRPITHYVTLTRKVEKMYKFGKLLVNKDSSPERKKESNVFEKEETSKYCQTDFLDFQTKTDFSNPKTDLPNAETDLPNPETDLPNPETDLTNPETDLTNPETDLSNPKTDLSNPETDLPNPETDLPNLETDLTNLETDLLNPKTDLPNPKIDFPNPKTDLPIPKKNLLNFEPKTPSCQMSKDKNTSTFSKNKVSKKSIFSRCSKRLMLREKNVSEEKQEGWERYRWMNKKKPLTKYNIQVQSIENTLHHICNSGNSNEATPKKLAKQKTNKPDLKPNFILDKFLKCHDDIKKFKERKRNVAKKDLKEREELRIIEKELKFKSKPPSGTTKEKPKEALKIPIKSLKILNEISPEEKKRYLAAIAVKPPTTKSAHKKSKKKVAGLKEEENNRKVSKIVQNHKKESFEFDENNLKNFGKQKNEEKKENKIQEWKFERTDFPSTSPIFDDFAYKQKERRKEFLAARNQPNRSLKDLKDVKNIESDVKEEKREKKREASELCVKKKEEVAVSRSKSHSNSFISNIRIDSDEIHSSIFDRNDTQLEMKFDKISSKIVEENNPAKQNKLQKKEESKLETKHRTKETKDRTKGKKEIKTKQKDNVENKIPRKNLNEKNVSQKNTAVQKKDQENDKSSIDTFPLASFSLGSEYAIIAEDSKNQKNQKPRNKNSVLLNMSQNALIDNLSERRTRLMSSYDRMSVNFKGLNAWNNPNQINSYQPVKQTEALNFESINPQQNDNIPNQTSHFPYSKPPLQTPRVHKSQSYHLPPHQQQAHSKPRNILKFYDGLRNGSLSDLHYKESRALNPNAPSSRFSVIQKPN